MIEEFIKRLPEMLKLASTSKFGIAAAVVFGIVATILILFKKAPHSKKIKAFFALCIFFFLFIAIIFFSSSRSNEKSISASVPAQATFGSVSPIQNNKTGDNNFSLGIEK